MNQKKRNLSKLINAIPLVALLVLGLALSACGNNSVTNNPSGTSTTTKTTIEAPGTTKENVSGAGTTPSTTAPGKGSTPTLPVITTPVASSAAGVGASAPDAAGGEAGGGDEPLKAYVDPAGQFSFQYPQSWGNSTQAGETIRFTGRDEFISLVITTTSLSPLDFGKADATALTNASPGYKGDALKTYPIAGTNGAMVSFTWQAGPSPVTGKMIASSARRYYIPGTGGKLAVFTYSSPTNTYDPFGADDFANAFKWLK